MQPRQLAIKLLSKEKTETILTALQDEIKLDVNEIFHFLSQVCNSEEKKEFKKEVQLVNEGDTEQKYFYYLQKAGFTKHEVPVSLPVNKELQEFVQKLDEIFLSEQAEEYDSKKLIKDSYFKFVSPYHDIAKLKLLAHHYKMDLSIDSDEKAKLALQILNRSVAYLQESQEQEAKNYFNSTCSKVYYPLFHGEKGYRCSDNLLKILRQGVYDNLNKDQMLLQFSQYLSDDLIKDIILELSYHFLQETPEKIILFHKQELTSKLQKKFQLLMEKEFSALNKWIENKNSEISAQKFIEEQNKATQDCISKLEQAGQAKLIAQEEFKKLESKLVGTKTKHEELRKRVADKKSVELDKFFNPIDNEYKITQNFADEIQNDWAAFLKLQSESGALSDDKSANQSWIDQASATKLSVQKSIHVLVDREKNSINQDQFSTIVDTQITQFANRSDYLNKIYENLRDDLNKKFELLQKNLLTMYDKHNQALKTDFQFIQHQTLLFKVQNSMLLVNRILNMKQDVKELQDRLLSLEKKYLELEIRLNSEILEIKRESKIPMASKKSLLMRELKEDKNRRFNDTNVETLSIDPVFKPRPIQKTMTLADELKDALELSTSIPVGSLSQIAKRRTTVRTVVHHEEKYEDALAIKNRAVLQLMHYRENYTVHVSKVDSILKEVLLIDTADHDAHVKLEKLYHQLVDLDDNKLEPYPEEKEIDKLKEFMSGQVRQQFNSLRQKTKNYLNKIDGYILAVTSINYSEDAAAEKKLRELVKEFIHFVNPKDSDKLLTEFFQNLVSSRLSKLKHAVVMLTGHYANIISHVTSSEAKKERASAFLLSVSQIDIQEKNAGDTIGKILSEFMDFCNFDIRIELHEEGMLIVEYGSPLEVARINTINASISYLKHISKIADEEKIKSSELESRKTFIKSYMTRVAGLDLKKEQDVFKLKDAINQFHLQSKRWTLGAATSTNAFTYLLSYLPFFGAKTQSNSVSQATTTLSPAKGKTS